MSSDDLRRLEHLASRRSGNIGAGDHEAIDALLAAYKRCGEEWQEAREHLESALGWIDTYAMQVRSRAARKEAHAIREFLRRKP